MKLPTKLYFQFDKNNPWKSPWKTTRQSAECVEYIQSESVIAALKTPHMVRAMILRGDITLPPEYVYQPSVNVDYTEDEYRKANDSRDEI